MDRIRAVWEDFQWKRLLKLKVTFHGHIRMLEYFDLQPDPLVALPFHQLAHHNLTMKLLLVVS